MVRIVNRPPPAPARSGKAGSATRDLGPALRAQAAAADVPDDVRAAIGMDAGPRARWSVHVSGGRMQIERGLPERATVTVTADPDTMHEVVRGRRSGVEAFLHGNLRVRGNLALALRLDSLLNPAKHPSKWPAWGSVRAAGVRTSYLEAGQGPPVVLLHGLGATNASLLTTLWDLAEDHRVIAPDLPGFGDSAKPLRAYHAAFFARWLEGFLDALGIERADVVGNSMGGRIALEIGLRAPERVGHLVLLMPSPAFIRYREFVGVVRYLRPELALLPVPISHKQVVTGIRRMFARPSRLPQAWYDAAADEFLRVFSSPGGRIAFFSAARQIYLEEPYGDNGFWDRLPSLSRPALFTWGQRDRLVPARFARHVEKALPHAASVVLPDCGHVPQYELPDRTNGLIREFLAT
jgi:pimeloyl-ACP methyl ester carboxylesterase